MANEPRVVRIRRKGGVVVQSCDVYIGREWHQGGWDLPRSKWANPYKVKDCKNVADACQRYEKYIRANRELMKSLPELEGKALGCWCDREVKCSTCGKLVGNCGHPQCHGDILVKLVVEASRKKRPEEKKGVAATKCEPLMSDGS